MRTVKDILKAKGQVNWSVRPASTVISALKLMKSKKEDALPVLEAGELAGVITETDCITKVILRGRSPEKIKVWETMTPVSDYITPDQNAKDCLIFMTEKHLRYLPVLDEGVFIGLLGTTDLYGSIITDQNNYIYRLENYVMGTGFNQ